LKIEFTNEEYVALQNKYYSYCRAHPKLTTTEKMIALNRLYEKAHYGVTSKSLERGYEIDYVPTNDGKFLKVQNHVRGRFVVGGDGNRGIGADPVAQYVRTSWDVVSKRMSKQELFRDMESQRTINLAATEHTTASDIMAKGAGLLEHSGIDTGFGATPGVIGPEYVNMLLEQVSAKSIFKNFVRIVPMPSMTFYFPMKTSKILDNATITAAVAPTAEGRAGTEFSISYNKFLVNGWKHLRHAALTVELIQMLSKYLMVREDYISDMKDSMALLWDFSNVEGFWSMLTAAKWRRYDVSGTAWTDSEYVPLSGASGADMLGVNAKKNYLYQDLTPGSANYGKIYEPLTATPTKYETSTLRAGSEAGDDLFELIVALATLLKAKYSKLEYFCAPPKVTEYFFRDNRFLDMTMATGNPAFQNENGYLGQIAIGGSNQRVDLWEYDPAILGTKATVDATPRDMHVVFGGAYGRAWNQGIFSPVYMRVDDGMEVVAGIGTGASNVLRPNETRVITVGSRGSSFPGDFHHIVMGQISLGFAHA